MWVYKGKPIDELPQDVFGFVYKITNLQNNKKYIGRKYIWVRKRKALTKAQKVSGKKRRTTIVTESNWKTYTGSSIELNKDIKNLGINNFSFEILIFGYTKGQVNYLEETIQHKLDVILKDDYYNTAVGSKKYIGVSIDDRMIQNLNELFS